MYKWLQGPWVFWFWWHITKLCLVSSVHPLLLHTAWQRSMQLYFVSPGEWPLRQRVLLVYFLTRSKRNTGIDAYAFCSVYLLARSVTSRSFSGLDKLSIYPHFLGQEMSVQWCVYMEFSQLLNFRCWWTFPNNAKVHSVQKLTSLAFNILLLQNVSLHLCTMLLPADK